MLRTIDFLNLGMLSQSMRGLLGGHPNAGFIRSHYFSVLFGQLEKEETYTAGSIANLAEKSGFLVGADQKKWVRLYINGLITRHKMPKDETKLVRVQGHPAIPGVMGKHFKAVYIEKLPFLL